MCLHFKGVYKVGFHCMCMTLPFSGFETWKVKNIMSNTVHILVYCYTVLISLQIGHEVTWH